MIRLMIADDHTLMREGLKQLFTLMDDIVVVGEAVNGTDVLERLRQQDVDVLLLDMTMPGICGEDLITRIRARHPELGILVLSMHNEPVVVQRALKAGASGYLSKDGDPDTLLAAVRKVASGGRYIDFSIAEKMIFGVQGAETAASHTSLSDRELQVLRMLAKGKSINEIADQFAISNKTISTHKARLMEKMGFESMADLIRYAINNDLSD
ncbi:MAG: response regulator transcription factor [Halothiobacillaceae bacterium]|nr:response regulator transcription factor [Halothiobacillaceae bacterium]